jgi:hypothetical protein
MPRPLRRAIPVCQGGGIHQPVDVAEALERRAEDHIRRVGVFEVRRHEQGGRPASLDLSRRGRALVGVSSRHHETFGASACNRLGDRQTHALGRPGDNDHPPFHAPRPRRVFSCDNVGSGILIVKFWKF